MAAHRRPSHKQRTPAARAAGVQRRAEPAAWLWSSPGRGRVRSATPWRSPPASMRSGCAVPTPFSSWRTGSRWSTPAWPARDGRGLQPGDGAAGVRGGRAGRWAAGQPASTPHL